MNRIHAGLAVLTAVLTAAALPARAQGHSHEGHDQQAESADAATPSSQDWIPAEVRRVDVVQQKLTLKHGDIRHLDMPGMTLPFMLEPCVVSASQLSAIKAGDRVEVRIESRDGAPTIIELRPATASN